MRAAILAAGLVLAVGVQAKDFSYNYVDAQVIDYKNNETDLTMSLVAGTLSLESHAGAIVQLFGGKGDADDILGGVGGPEGDAESYEIFLGGSRQICDHTNVWTGFGLGNLNIDPDNASDEDLTSGRFSLGIRQWVISRVEANASASYLYFDGDNVEHFDDTEVKLGLRLYPLKNVSIGADAAWQFDQRTQVFSASARYEF